MCARHICVRGMYVCEACMCAWHVCVRDRRGEIKNECKYVCM